MPATRRGGPIVQPAEYWRRGTWATRVTELGPRSTQTSFQSSRLAPLDHHDGAVDRVDARVRSQHVVGQADQLGGRPIASRGQRCASCSSSEASVNSSHSVRKPCHRQQAIRPATVRDARHRPQLLVPAQRRGRAGQHRGVVACEQQYAQRPGGGQHGVRPPGLENRFEQSGALAAGRAGPQNRCWPFGAIAAAPSAKEPACGPRLAVPRRSAPPPTPCASASPASTARLPSSSANQS